MGDKTSLDLDRLWLDVTDYLGNDVRRINHAKNVLEYAKEILKSEKADRETVEAAAMLHDIGIHEAERKYGSSAGHYQESEGPPIARDMLERLNAGNALIDHVCKIIASHHSPGEINTPEFHILWDSDWLVNIPEEYPNIEPEELSRLIERVFQTSRGRELAIKLLNI